MRPADATKAAVAATKAAANAIRDADAILVTTGAGMGVDSGLGTFRGRNAGVWAPLEAMGLDFSEMSNPRRFEEDPRAAWAFWRFRHQAYTKSTPHEGYKLVARWGSSKPGGIFSVTSNIDGHWERTLGADKVYEAHGALTHMQHLESAADDAIWPTDDAAIETLKVPEWDLKPGDAVEVLHSELDEWQPACVAADGCSLVTTKGKPMTARGVRRPGAANPDLCRVSCESTLPVDATGRALRPNVLMFGDGGFADGRSAKQKQRLDQWLGRVGINAKIAIVEIGAGLAVPTIRWFSERHLAKLPNASLIRINLDDPDVTYEKGRRAIPLGGMGALEALRAIDKAMRAAARA